ncbi:hypothetical protein [uncultured Alsobacter sp.]|uniref:AAA family ATPase n=1 Tax=uncultured Alsobacter sp. TaxID=1748258 RepID=UPI0025D91A8B|nr:hypothetical protein [uncultured Alsobacter sp.]
MKALIAAADTSQDIVQNLAQALRQSRLAVELLPMTDLGRRMARPPLPDLVMVADLDGTSHLAEAVLSYAQDAPGPVFVVYIGEAMDAEAYRSLVRTGRGDWVRWRHLSTELPEVVTRLMAARQAGAQAKIVSFQPVQGGVGNTMLAMETAIALASRKGQARKRTCVLDLNLQSSALPDYYEVEPRFNIAELLDDPSRLDEHLVDLLVTQHPAGVDVICSPAAHTDYARVNNSILFSLLDLLSLRYDFIHIDLQKTWFPWTETLLSGSDAVITTGLYHVPAIKRMGSELARLKTLNVRPEARAFVVNRFVKSLFGSTMRRSDAEQALAGERVFFVHDDAENAVEAVNTGRSILQNAKGRALISDITAIAEWLEPAEAEKSKPDQPPPSGPE